MAEKYLGFKTAADPSGEAGLDEPLNLKKRARRRLVGAIALALLAVIVLPMVMDQEPKPLTQDIQIRIPSQETGAASQLSRLVPGKPLPTPLPAEIKPVAPTPAPAPPVAAVTPTPAAPADKKAAAQPEPRAEPPRAVAPATPSPAAENIAEIKAAEKSVDKPAAKSPPTPQKSESTRAAAHLNGEQWVIQLGAYKDQANVKALQARLKENGYPSYTEKVETPQGERMRVRGGPFASREAAEKAQARLKKLAVGAPVGGVVAQKP